MGDTREMSRVDIEAHQRAPQIKEKNDASTKTNKPIDVMSPPTVVAGAAKRTITTNISTMTTSLAGTTKPPIVLEEEPASLTLPVSAKPYKQVPTERRQSLTKMKPAKVKQRSTHSYVSSEDDSSSSSTASTPPESATFVPQALRLRDLLQTRNMQSIFHNRSHDDEVNHDAPRRDKYKDLSIYPTITYVDTLSSAGTDILTPIILRSTILIYAYCGLASILESIASFVSRDAIFVEYDLTSWTSFYLCCAAFWGHALYTVSTGKGPLEGSLKLSGKVILAIGSLQLLFQSLIPRMAGLLFSSGCRAVEDCVTTFGSINVLLQQNFPLQNNVSSTHLIFQFAPLFSFPFLFLLSKMHLAHTQENAQKEAFLKEEREKVQRVLDHAISEYTERRSVFLSTVADELQDATNMAFAILEQFAPGSIFTKTQELLSACSIPVPTASISALNATLKHVRHISTHLPNIANILFAQEAHDNGSGHGHTEEECKSRCKSEFDIGELVQSVGDALAGTAAKLGVELVLYHSDNALHYLNVVGDEGGFRHALMNLLRTILDSCNPGACVELGLKIGFVPDSAPSESNASAFPVLPKKGDRLLVTFEIIHNPSSNASADTILCPNANLTHKLFMYLGGTFRIEELEGNRHRVEVTVEVRAGDPVERRVAHDDPHSQRLVRRHATVKYSNEPTLEELIRFLPSLKGLKVVLHAAGQSVFAKHLSNCLTSWDTDISHVPVKGLPLTDDGSAAPVCPSADGGNTTPISETGGMVGGLVGVISSPQVSGSVSPVNEHPQLRPKIPSMTKSSAEEQQHQMPPTFILIDDDIQTLEQKLTEFRTQPPPLAQTGILQYHHQHRRHKRGKPSNCSTNNTPPNFFHTTTAIIHFTSLANYKQVRDAVQWLVNMPIFQPFALPQVLVIPKPAGPRRFLTALHTAMIKAVVEPHYMPIATSPSSPMANSGHFSQCGFTPPSTPGTLSQGVYNAESGNSEAMKRGLVSINASSPALSGNYFPDSNVLIPSGNGNVSPGAALQGSPTGVQTPEGIVFNPSSNKNSTQMSPPTQGRAPMSPGGLGRGIRTSSGNLLLMQQNSMLSRKSNTDLRDAVANEAAGAEQGSGATNSSAAVSSVGGLMPTAIGGIVASPQGFPHPPLGQVSPGGSPLKMSVTSADLSPSTPTTSLAATPNVGDKPLPLTAIPQVQSTIDSTPSASQSDDALAISDALSATTAAVGGGASSAGNTSVTPQPAISPTPQKKTPVSNTDASESAVRSASLRTGKRRVVPKRSTLMNAAFPGVISPPINVLIVEDNPINQSILSAWMRKHKIKYSVASNGQEAVDKWKLGGFHLVLMDIQLPVMDGIDATKEIRRLERVQKIGVFPSTPSSLQSAPSSPTTSSPPSVPSSPPPSPFRSPVIIVALTASSLESDRHAALAAGCNDFLTKPVNLEWLEKKIIEWGCMQALIDFEGWRKWKKSEDSLGGNTNKVAATIAATEAMGALGGGIGLAGLAARASGSLAGSPGAQLKKGILLQGGQTVAKRRSTDEEKIDMDRNPRKEAEKVPQETAATYEDDGQKKMEKMQASSSRSLMMPLRSTATTATSSHLPPIQEASSSRDTSDDSLGSIAAIPVQDQSSIV